MAMSWWRWTASSRSRWMTPSSGTTPHKPGRSKSGCTYPARRRLLLFQGVLDDLFDGFGAAKGTGGAPGALAEALQDGGQHGFVTLAVSGEERAVVFLAQRLRRAPQLRAALEAFAGKSDFGQAFEVPGDAVVVLILPAQRQAA